MLLGKQLFQFQLKKIQNMATHSNKSPQSWQYAYFYPFWVNNMNSWVLSPGPGLGTWELLIVLSGPLLGSPGHQTDPESAAKCTCLVLALSQDASWEKLGRLCEPLPLSSPFGEISGSLNLYVKGILLWGVRSEDLFAHFSPASPSAYAFVFTNGLSLSYIILSRV